MSKEAVATRADIEDVLDVIQTFSFAVDSRFNDLEREVRENGERVRKILNILDGFAKGQEINDDERLVMGHQLDRLDRWTQELASKIGHKLSR